MSEYIDREKIMLKTCSDCTRQVNLVCKHPEPCGKLISAFLCEEQEDVAPVVREKWLDEDFPQKQATVHGFAVCSACGELSHKAEHGYNILSRYCPNCGAKMDLTED